MSALIQRLEYLYRDVLRQSGPVSLHSPSFGGHEWDYLKDCLDSGWVSSAGSWVDEFEKRVAELCGTRHAIATVNGTAALHVALHALGVTEGDLVVCPPLTFVATANAVAYCGAAPLFVDIEESTLGLDPSEVGRLFEEECEQRPEGLVHRETNSRIAAVLAVHVFGHPVAIDRLAAICEDRGVPLVEDSAEALGSSYHDRACGSWGLLAALSFNGNKIITTGGGGIVTTDDDELARRVRHLTTTARQTVENSWYVHDEVGFNYRLPNLNAALGCAQLEQLDGFLRRKRRLAALYAEHLADIDEVRVMAEPPGACSNYWLNAIWLADSAARDAFLDAAVERDIEARPCWWRVCDLPMYRAAPRRGAMPVSQYAVDRLVTLPSSAWLCTEEGI
jgi:perosamine synthetase